jgi:hypothetical protein
MKLKQMEPKNMGNYKMRIGKIEKILGALTLSGALTFGAGALVKNKDIKDIGLGGMLTGMQGYAYSLALGRNDESKKKYTLALNALTSVLTLGAGALLHNRELYPIGIGEATNSIMGYAINYLMDRNNHQ